MSLQTYFSRALFLFGTVLSFIQISIVSKMLVKVPDDRLFISGKWEQNGKAIRERLKHIVNP